MRCYRFFKRAASFEQPVNLIVQRFRAGAAGKRSPEQRVLYQLVEQQMMIRMFWAFTRPESSR